MHQKYKHLTQIISSYESLVVAFSGGVDSAFLLKVAYDVLGEKVIGITVSTPYIADWEIKDAQKIAQEIGAKHKVVQKPWNEILHNNPKNRCYICKRTIFSSLLLEAQENGLNAIAEGSNVDDTKEFRPGRAALGELGIKTPLLEAGLTKSEIRVLSHDLGLSTWSKPSYACLLTRFPYDKKVEEKALHKVGAAEEYMIRQGYGELRVRYEDGLARIEMPENEMIRFLSDARLNVLRAHLKSLGFLHVTLDIEGYRHDSIAESLHLSKETSK